MSLKGKTIQGVIWSAIQNWGSQFSALLVFLLLARILDPGSFGLVALANVFIALMRVFLEQGFAQALIQRQEIEPEHIDTAFWTSVATGFVLTAIGLGTANWVAAGFNQPQLAPIICWLSLSFIASSLNSVQRALLERQFAFQAIAVRFLISTVIGGMVGLGLALQGWGVWSLVGQQLVQEWLGAILLWSASDWRPRLRFSLPHLRQLLNFGVNILGLNFLGFFNNRSDDLLIGYFLGSTALGYYSVAYRILTVMTELLVGTSSKVALPAFSRLQQEPDRFRKAFYSATQLTSSIAFPGFLATAVLAPELIEALFGSQWLAAVPVMQILSFVGLLRTVSYFKGSIFSAMGKPGWHLRLNILSASLNVIGFSISVRWGIAAVACAYLLRACIVFPISQTAVGKLIQAPMSTYLQLFISPLLCSTIMAAVIWVTRRSLSEFANLQVQLAICSIAGAIVYVLAMRFLAPQLFNQIKEIALTASLRTDNQRA
jgi:O-antigen/teichoic acid export membrane protein